MCNNWSDWWDSVVVWWAYGSLVIRRTVEFDDYSLVVDTGAVFCMV